MQITLIDTEKSWQQMLPMSYTRPVAAIRIGILQIHEKWERHLDATVSFRSQEYLTPTYNPPNGKTLTILGNILPTTTLINKILSLREIDVLTFHGQVIAGFFDSKDPFEVAHRKEISLGEVTQVIHPWDIFRLNGEEIKKDYTLITAGRNSQPLTDPYTKTYGQQLFIEEGAKIKAATLNTEDGPIYIGKGAEIQEGASIQGPFALCDHSVVNMGAKMKDATTIGPHSKVGGEIINSVIFGYSNKGHDGFLGNSVLGEWCNLGAGTNSSNLKNNYTNVKMWDFASRDFKDTGLQFCGLIMGDHSKCGINMMFNTGTIVGVSVNTFGAGFSRTFIPSFSWGGATGFTTYLPKKAMETATLMMKRRNKDLTTLDKAMLCHIFEMTAENRVWENK